MEDLQYTTYISPDGPPLTALTYIDGNGFKLPFKVGSPLSDHSSTTSWNHTQFSTLLWPSQAHLKCFILLEIVIEEIATHVLAPSSPRL